MKVLVTGSTGMVGRGLIRKLITHPELQVFAGLRRKQTDLDFGGAVCQIVLADFSIDPFTLPNNLGVDVVVHTAARVHVMKESAKDPLAEFRLVNTQGTLALARKAAACGARRFVFLSSIKVNGEETFEGKPFGYIDSPHPEHPYAISKLEAEQGLRQIAFETGMDVVVIRPPLIYGPGVKANFLAMMRWLHRGIPLPLGSITDNRRSLLALDNLVDLMITCMSHPSASNQTFVASDGEDLSTADLLLRLGRAMGKPARLIRVPPRLLQSGARLVGRGDLARRLLGSLQVDMQHTRNMLGWNPPVTVDEGLRLAASAFQS